MEHLRKDDPELAALTDKEAQRIENTINLIAAENHSPKSIMEIMGSVFNTKTIEGYPGNRYHAGCVNVDAVETLGIERAKKLFGAGYANLQPHSGTSANLAVYFSVLQVGDKILSMSLPHGGHLSHGHRASITSKCFDFKHYTINEQTGLIDYEQIRQMAHEFKPKMIVVGASSYPRLIDYEKIAEIAKEVDAYTLADSAHIGGLIAGGAIPSPVPHCDFVTTTCYKTMMGGRGGLILAKEEYGKKLDKAVFPGTQGTSAVNLIAAKALILKIAAKPEFAAIQKRTIVHSKLMAKLFTEKGYHVVTGDSDNHQVVLDLSASKGVETVTGGQAETALEDCGLVLNRNAVPSDAARKPGTSSGLRIGTAGITTRGMGEAEVTKIVELMDTVIRNVDDAAKHQDVSAEVAKLCAAFPVYAEGHELF